MKQPSVTFICYTMYPVTGLRGARANPSSTGREAGYILDWSPVSHWPVTLKPFTLTFKLVDNLESPMSLTNPHRQEEKYKQHTERPTPHHALQHTFHNCPDTFKVIHAA